MKTTSMIALIAVISAVSLGAISMNGFSAIPLATASVNPESGTIMGHVEYILRDADGNIKSYVQGDNMVVNKGDDCVIGYAFQTTAAGSSDNCTTNSNGFRFIGIGNGTITVDAADTTLLDAGATTVAGGSPGAEGIMAVRADSNTVGTASSNGGTVVIATESPFTFVAANATTVTAAGLFDATCSGVSGTTGACTANASTMNMFSAQSISVAVASGDSLSVTWTITVGSAA
ncbi:MAG: hypothetical protein HZB73_06605 [Nitrosarchaeum sp.]|nr:hypothetical protein [Nitrosarchaeum sp.]